MSIVVINSFASTTPFLAFYYILSWYTHHSMPALVTLHGLSASSSMIPQSCFHDRVCFQVIYFLILSRGQELSRTAHQRGSSESAGQLESLSPSKASPHPPPPSHTCHRAPCTQHIYWLL